MERDSIDKEMFKLNVLRSHLKIQINSTYGTSMSNVNFLFDKRNEITHRIKRLHKIKTRQLKLDKILQRNKESMEV